MVSLPVSRLKPRKRCDACLSILNHVCAVSLLLLAKKDSPFQLGTEQACNACQFSRGQPPKSGKSGRLDACDRLGPRKSRSRLAFKGQQRVMGPIAEIGRLSVRKGFP